MMEVLWLFGGLVMSFGWHYFVWEEEFKKQPYNFTLYLFLLILWVSYIFI